VRRPLGVSVAPFGSVAKEGRVVERVYFFPMPMFSIKPDSKIQNVAFFWLTEGGSLAALREASCLSCERTLISNQGEVVVKKGVDLVAHGP
jgi:hypothetical protein